MLDKLYDGMTERLQPHGLSPLRTTLNSCWRFRWGCSFSQPVQIEWVRHAGLVNNGFLTWHLFVNH